jgi:hypothetical protein
MADDIKAIETNYRGCRFRSRLEARWAVFFDALGWDWEYEKQGYTIGYYEEKKLPWLPDFEVVTPNGQHFYVEVKGDPDFFAEGSWLERFDFDGGPPAFAHCGDTDDFSKTSKPLLLLGSVPRSNEGATEFFVPVIVHKEGVHGHWAKLTQQGLEIQQHYLWDNIQVGSGITNFQVNAIGSYDADTAVARAMRAASGARFEHGEKPRGHFND